VCIWIIHLGRIKALLTASDEAVLWAASNAFRLNFADSSNAPAARYMLPLDPDGRRMFFMRKLQKLTRVTAKVTFFKFSLDALDSTWLAGQAAVELSLPRGIRYETNDLGGRFHRKLASLRLPLANVKVFLAATRNRQTWLEAAEFVTDAFLDVYSSPPGWVDKSRAQAEFIHAQSAPTGRAEHMFKAFRADYIPFGNYSVDCVFRILILKIKITLYTGTAYSFHNHDYLITQGITSHIYGQACPGMQWSG
jgi:hypothetical protein